MSEGLNFVARLAPATLAIKFPWVNTTPWPKFKKNESVNETTTII